MKPSSYNKFFNNKSNQNKTAIKQNTVEIHDLTIRDGMTFGEHLNTAGRAFLTSGIFIACTKYALSENSYVGAGLSISAALLCITASISALCDACNKIKEKDDQHGTSLRYYGR